MRQISPNSVFTLLAVTTLILLGFVWTPPGVRPPAQAQGIVPQPLPLTTAYFYGPVSVSENQMVKMCSNNFFGDGSVRFMAAAINAADGSVLVARDISLPSRGGQCLTFRTTESLEILGVLWSLGNNWGEFTWSSARASGPLASLQVVDVETNHVVAILNTPGKVTVDSNLLPAVQK